MRLPKNLLNLKVKNRMQEEYISENEKETWKIAKEVLQKASEQGVNVVLLQGELGAGKTTFSQGVLDAVGAEGPYTSPTFVIMKRYELNRSKFEIGNLKSASKLPASLIGGQVSSFKFVYHFDCYRVGAEGILDLGWEEIVADPQNLVLVEWPEKIEKIWPKKYIKLNFVHLEKNRRKILISSTGL